MGDLVREIVGAARGRGNAAASDAAASLNATASCDYATHLKRYFSQREMHALVGALTAAIPGLNRQVIKIQEPDKLGAVASRMGALLRLDGFAGRDGSTLRGFYVDDRHVSRRPLICVNKLQHPIALASAFWHEVGHHVTRGFIDRHRERVISSFDWDYGEHLEDPPEIVADLAVALTSYPHPIARRLFINSRNDEPCSPERMVTQAISHLRRIANFSFEPTRPAAENLHYLAGLTHYAKLRGALLGEYNI